MKSVLASVLVIMAAGQSQAFYTDSNEFAFLSTYTNNGHQTRSDAEISALSLDGYRKVIYAAQDDASFYLADPSNGKTAQLAEALQVVQAAFPHLSEFEQLVLILEM